MLGAGDATVSKAVSLLLRSSQRNENQELTDKCYNGGLQEVQCEHAGAQLTVGVMLRTILVQVAYLPGLGR